MGKRGAQIEEPSLNAKRRLTQVYMRDKKQRGGKYSVAKFIASTPELAVHIKATMGGWLRKT